MNNLSRELNDYKSTKFVSKVQFGILGPDEIRNSSVCEVKKPETFDGLNPVINGLFDPRMGVIDRGLECATCENNHALCPGHFGHIELTMPVFYIHFMRSPQNYIINLLSCVCFRCSSLLIKKKKIFKDIKDKTGEKRFKTICKSISKTNLYCNNNGCKIQQPYKYTLLTSDKIRSVDKKLALDKNMVVAIIAEFKEEAIKNSSISRKQKITPSLCYEIFRKISDEDFEFLGFNPKYTRPEWMICTVLQVPPPSVRPSVQRENNQRSEDDLTCVLLSIIKANNQLRRKIENNEEQKKIDYAYETLQLNVLSLVNNKIPGIQQIVQRTGKLIKSIQERITSKTGRIRGNLVGKRVDYSARTVISVDPNISIEEFGMPRKIAMIVTYPEIVTQYNIKDMENVVRNGPNIHPGAKKIERIEYDCFGSPSPCIINLKHIDPSTIKLKIGDVVHRHIRDGDICLFNRQPSLHRMSMMAHKARIVENNTFKLNVFVCKPYNADFDGDEMNTFIPQTIQSSIEISSLASVSSQLISPQTSKPIITVVQDSMTGSFLMTKKEYTTTGEKIFNYLMNTTNLKNNFDIQKIREKNKWSGNELFSLILPNINLKNENIEIKNGVIKNGFMNKTTLGGGSRGIIQTIINQYGNETCKDFLDNLQRLINIWLENNSFSIGFGDMIPVKNIQSDIKKIQNEKKNEVYDLINKAKLGLYQPYLSDKMKNISLEIAINNIADELNQKTEISVFDNLPENNNFMISINAGTKGAKYNLREVIGAFGPQKVDGKRLPYGLSGRVLSHFTKWNKSLESNGFVFNSYMNGLTPQEFFYISIGSRSDAIDGKLKTAETGYIQRRLIKSMEDLCVKYDGTIRDAVGNIVQVNYGEDGYDCVKIEDVPFFIINMDNEEMEKTFLWKIDTQMESVVTEETYAAIVSNKTNELKMENEWKQLLLDRDNTRYKHFPNLTSYVKYIASPVNIERLIDHIQKSLNIGFQSQSDLTPEYVIDKVSELVEYVNKYNSNKSFSPIIKIFIRSNLSSKQCIVKYRLTKMIFNYLIDTIKNKILYAIVDPGEMVGIIAAQSIGEPLTQMNLNTFHFSGLSSTSSLKTITGVPRIQEIVNVSKDIKTPSMKIYLKKEYSKHKEFVFNIKNNFEYTELNDLILSSNILYIPNNIENITSEDENYKIYKEIEELTSENPKCHKNLSNWVLCIEFDKEIMLKKNIYMSDIHEEIVRNCNVETDFECLISDMNSNRLTLRIRVIRKLDEGENYISFFQHISDNLSNISIRGIKNLINVEVLETKRIEYNTDGKPEEIEEWFLQTNGSNLISVLSNEYVDIERTTTNDISEIHSLFGIEGVRNAIIRELEITLTENGSNMNKRHYTLLADIMTYRGQIMQIRKAGFGKSPYIGPLGRATFEEMDKVLISAGVFSEVDDMNGTSSNIILGQVVKAGTNSFTLSLNKKYLPNAENNIKNIESDDNKTSKNNTFNNYMTNIQKEQYSYNNGDFLFGYNITEMEEYVLPKDNYEDIQLNIIKSKK